MFGSWIWRDDRGIAEEDIQQRISRKCGAAASAYRNCLRANSHEAGDTCRNLKRQLIYCQSMILCGTCASEYARCIERTVRGKEGYDKCDKVFRNMEQCLLSRENKKFLPVQHE